MKLVRALSRGFRPKVSLTSLGQVQVTARVVAGTDRGAKGGLLIGGEISDVPSAPEVKGDKNRLAASRTKIPSTPPRRMEVDIGQLRSRGLIRAVSIEP